VSLELLSGFAFYFVKIEAVGILAAVGIASKARYPESVLMPADSRVCKQWERRYGRVNGFKGGIVDGGIGRGHEGSYRLIFLAICFFAGIIRAASQQYRFIGVRIEAYRYAVRQNKKFTALR